MTVTFNNYSTKEPLTLHLEGDMLGRSADIKLEDGRVVAQIDRQLFKKDQVLSNKESVSEHQRARASARAGLASS